jgi:predicted GNAT superfamily acetyltransferase
MTVSPHVEDIEIRTLSDVTELVELGDVLCRVWGTDTPIVNLEMARAIGHSGGYVAGAYADVEGSGPTMVGASVGLLATHDGRTALHSHVTGLLPEARHTGLGRRIKLHQREWASGRDIEWITWTFDPLVRRNAWFNIAVLGAEVHDYLTDFYGTMTDAINAGDSSDRLHVAWRVSEPPPRRPRDGSDTPDARLVPTPDDIVTMRRTDPAAVARWRERTRDALTTALAAGDRIVGFTREGNYVIGSHR